MSKDAEAQSTWTDLYDKDGELIGMVQEDRLHILRDENDYPVYVIPSVNRNIPPENCYTYAHGSPYSTYKEILERSSDGNI